LLVKCEKVGSSQSEMEGAEIAKHLDQITKLSSKAKKLENTKTKKMN